MNIKSIFHQVQLRQQRALSWLFLQVIYFVGFGPTSLIARLIGKEFLGVKNRESTWEKHSKVFDTKKMF